MSKTLPCWRLQQRAAHPGIERRAMKSVACHLPCRGEGATTPMALLQALRRRRRAAGPQPRLWVGLVIALALAGTAASLWRNPDEEPHLLLALQVPGYLGALVHSGDATAAGGATAPQGDKDKHP